MIGQNKYLRIWRTYAKKKLSRYFNEFSFTFRPSRLYNEKLFALIEQNVHNVQASVTPWSCFFKQELKTLKLVVLIRVRYVNN